MEKSINFLLLEDNELDAEKVERAFKKLNISNPIIRAKNGVEGLELLRGENGKKVEKPRIVLLDLNMPKMNGLEFLKEIRNDEDLKKTQVFVLTTSNHKKDIETSHELCVQGYIVKPLEKQQLIEAFTTLKTFWELVEHPKSGLEG